MFFYLPSVGNMCNILTVLCVQDKALDNNLWMYSHTYLPVTQTDKHRWTLLQLLSRGGGSGGACAASKIWAFPSLPQSKYESPVTPVWRISKIAIYVPNSCTHLEGFEWKKAAYDTIGAFYCLIWSILSKIRLYCN